jgi:hypothetical protein
MNERIRELAEQAGYYLYDLTETHECKTVETDSKDEWITLEKFAELIVRECIKDIEFQYGGGNLMEDGETHNPEWDNAIECVSAMIQKHFGVEE